MMDWSENIRRALFDSQRKPSLIEEKANRVSAIEAASSAYKLLFRHFWTIAQLLLLPIAAAGLVLYICLSAYLSELVLFITSPNPHVASLALGILAAGLFLSLFCYAVAVAAVSNFALGRATAGTKLRFKVERQEWRLYASYLWFLLLLSGVFACVEILSIYILPIFAMTRNFSPWILAGLCFIGVYWLIARVGFLIAPVVAMSEGSVLRTAWQESGHDLWRNCGLIFLLLVPGALVQIAGEYALRISAVTPHLAVDEPLVDYARTMEQTLAGFLLVASLSIFVTVVLLTAGAVASYRSRRFPVHSAERPGFGPKVGSVRVETLPE